MNSFLEGMYGLTWRLARPLLRRHKRLAPGFPERLVQGAWETPLPNSGPVIWLQAASGGEARLAHALLEALLAGWPVARPLHILATSCTIQGKEVLSAYQVSSRLHPSVTLTVRFFPLDSPHLMHQALCAVRPSLIVLLETELWPGLLAKAREASIPVMVLNGRMTGKTRRGYAWLSGFFARNGPCRVLAVSGQDAVRFEQVFPRSRVSVMPNIKFDLAWQSLQAILTSGGDASPPGSALAVPPETLLLALASVREQEEEQLTALIPSLLSQTDGSVLLAVAPRHMERVPAWKTRLQKLGLRVQLRSDRNRDLMGCQVLLWDTFGELGLLYAQAGLTFVGGSLHPLGGQNFLESLATGALTVIGPHCSNFVWALDGLEEEGLLRVVQNAPELEVFLQDAVSLFRETSSGLWQERRLARQKRFSSWLAMRRGGSQAAAAALLACLEKAIP